MTQQLYTTPMELMAAPVILCHYSRVFFQFLFVYFCFKYHMTKLFIMGIVEIE